MKATCPSEEGEDSDITAMKQILDKALPVTSKQVLPRLPQSGLLVAAFPVFILRRELNSATTVDQHLKFLKGQLQAQGKGVLRNGLMTFPLHRPGRKFANVRMLSVSCSFFFAVFI